MTRMIHTEFTGIAELLNVTDEPPGTATREAEPPQFDREDETGLASTILAGNESTSDTCVSAKARSLFRIRMIS